MHLRGMEYHQEDIDAFLAHLAEKPEMKDAEPYQIAAVAAMEMCKQFTRNGAKRDIDMAIIFAQMSLRYEHNTPEITNGLLSNLGIILESRYEQLGDMADLEKAIQISRQAIALASKTHSDLVMLLNNLNHKLNNRYKKTKDITDLDEAIQNAQQIVALTPQDHFQLAGRLDNLSNIFESRHNQTRDIVDLEKAIQVARQAITLTPENHPDLTMYLNNLGNKLQSRYKQTGDITNFEEAIQVARQAVRLAFKYHFDPTLYMNNLSNMLQIRYERTEDMTDLDEAIQIARHTVVLTSKSHSNLADRLNNLGNRIGRRYKRTGNIADLEEAIQVDRQAIALMPKGHLNLAGHLTNLGNKLWLQYKHTNNIADFKEAIQIVRQAAALISKNHFESSSILSNLSWILQNWYELTRDIADLEEALQIARQAVASIPTDYTDQARCLNILGTSLVRLYKRTGDMANLVEANRVFGRSWTSYSSEPFHRIYAASQYLKTLFHLEQYDEAAEIAVSVINLLPIVNTRSLDRNDKQHVLSRFVGIAADACGVILQARDPETALQYLERSRAVILGQIIDYWSDLSSLMKAHPELATKFKTLRDTVNTRSGHSSSESDRIVTAHRRRAAAAELEQCIQSIQGIPGQELFMKAQNIKAIQACVVGGNVVVVNVSTLRSDAIIVSPTSIRAICLPSLSAADAKIWINKQWYGRRSERAARNKEYTEFLKWLWEVCVKHILDAIGCTKNVSIEHLSRIWWIGTGLASSMPFHAAGKHSPGSTENTFSHVISSYATSIKALSQSRTRCSVHVGSQLKALVATMPVTPGMKPGRDRLPGVVAEKRCVMEILRHCTTVEEIEQPSAEAVIHKVQQCNIAHFASHGRTNHIDPSSSGLILQRKDETGNAVQDVLTVHALSEINLQYAQLAYLSACSTAENKAAALADEAIHIVSGFQAAGFPHVIGCLWPSVDKVCVEVARGFYASLVEQGILRLESKGIATALHTSVMKVRARDWKLPLNWAQFVHYGA
ncbi:hypothetical protein B7463_g11074, partial [Scytalidium lignicola]